MKRSELNSLILDALDFMSEMRFLLPPWAKWSPEDWKGRGPKCDEIRRCGLGWDLTDFGSGEFFKTGLLLFTLRNGHPSDGPAGKPYAEKIMVVREGQTTPTHFHWRKTEDIINHGGGELVMTLNMASTGDEGAFSKSPFLVSVDGVSRLFQPGEVLRLKPGESVCLKPYVYHSFHAEGATTLVGEVSSVNDDASDNRFLKPCGRFPAIEEDAPARFLLCTEYPL